MLSGKRILLGVCGSIAAYKSAILVRLLVKEGADVQVVMTEDATTLITPLTLSTLSKRPVLKDFATPDGQWNNHVSLAEWADLLLIAPVSANTLAKMANGFCDNLLTTTYLSAKCPVAVAPAMDIDMGHHHATQRNIEQAKQDGVTVLPVGEGELASGLKGEGRMAEPEEIVSMVQQRFFTKEQTSSSTQLAGNTFLVTAGPTVEPIDPVRFISNHSSGKMGMALAKTIAERGGRVILLKGQTAIEADHENIETIAINTAEELYEISLKYFPQVDVAIAAAAVSDYTPVQQEQQKIKKKDENLTLELTKTKDVLGEWGNRKKNGQLLIGFALETDQEIDHARSKMKDKDLDMVVLNSLQDAGAGFGHDTNKITILDKYNNIIRFELKAKKAVAEDIIDQMTSQLHA